MQIPANRIPKIEELLLTQSITLLMGFDYSTQIQLQRTLENAFVANPKTYQKNKNWVNFLLSLSSTKNQEFELAAKFSEEISSSSPFSAFLALTSQGVSQSGLNRQLASNRCFEAISKMKNVGFSELTRTKQIQTLTASHYLAESLMNLRNFSQAAVLCDLQLSNLEKVFCKGHYIGLRWNLLKTFCLCSLGKFSETIELASKLESEFENQRIFLGDCWSFAESLQPWKKLAKIFRCLGLYQKSLDLCSWVITLAQD